MQVMDRVLVTAALGNVGREVVHACAQRGFTVRASGLNEAALKARFPAMEVARLDFLDRTTWSAALDGCASVFLLRPPPLGDMDTTLCPFVDASYAAGVKHIVFLSVAGADRMKWVPHRKVELHLEGHGDGWTVLRPGFFAQNLQDAYRRDIVEDGRIYVPAANGRVAFLDVRDAAEIAAHIFEDPGAFQRKMLTLTGPEAITFHEAAALLSTTLKRSIVYTPASIPSYAWHLRTRRNMTWMQTFIQTILHVGLRRGDADHVEPTVEQVLGKRPRTMAEYIRDAESIWRT